METGKKASKFFILFYVFVHFNLIISYAQKVPSESFIKEKKISSYQKEFNAWAKGKDLKTTKGWKWYKRWEEFFSQRTPLSGNIPHPDIYMNEVFKLTSSISNNNRVGKNGANWQPVGPDYFPPMGTSYYGMGRVNCITFHPTDSNIIWIGVAQGGIWKTTDAGQSWLPLTDDLPVIRISDIAVQQDNPDIIYACVGDYAYLGFGMLQYGRKRNTHFGIGVYKTTDGGTTWQPTGLTFNLNSGEGTLMRRVFIHPSNPDTLVAAGISGIWKSYDAGSTWTHILDSLIWDIEANPLQPEVLYASGGYNGFEDIGSAGIMKSTDFGSTWKWLNTGIPEKNSVQRIELQVAPSDTNYVYALACDMEEGLYGVYKSIDAGNSWVLKSSYPNILEWYDGSGSGGQGTYDLSLLVNPYNKDIIYTGGVNLWMSTDGGTNWINGSMWYYSNSLHADQHQFQYNPADKKYYVCNDAGVSRTDTIDISDPFLTDWEFITKKLQITSFYRMGLCKSFPEYLVSGAQDNSTFFKQQNNWSQISGGDGMDCTMHPTDTNFMIVSSQYGNIEYSTDGGNNFSDISYNNENGEWTTPFMLNPLNPNTLYAAYGNVVKKTGIDNYWEPISNFPVDPNFGYPNISSALAIAPTDTNTIYVAKRVYHIYNMPSSVHRTSDGGQNWIDITKGLPDTLYPTSIAVDENDAKIAWITYSGFIDSVKVFKTKDGGVTWENISQNLPNLPANTIIQQSGITENFVYVGMDVGIYYTSDTSNKWYLYNDGLPNVIITDLEIDTLNKKLYACTFGRGVWNADLKQGTPCVAPEAADSINGPDKLCDGDTALFYVPFSNDTLFRWDIPVNSIILSETDNDSISVLWADSGKVCVRVKNNCGLSPPVCVNVKNCLSSLSDVNKTVSKILIFPNPAQNELVIKFPENVSGNAKISIQTIVGQTVFSTEISVLQNKFNKINIDRMQAGIYFLTIQTNSENLTHLFIKEL